MPLLVTDRWTPCARDEQSDQFALNGGRLAARTVRSRVAGPLSQVAILRAHLPRREGDQRSNGRGFGKGHMQSALDSRLSMACSAFLPAPRSDPPLWGSAVASLAASEARRGLSDVRPFKMGGVSPSCGVRTVGR